MTKINVLWSSGQEDDWRSALEDYWKPVKPDHLVLEKEFDFLNIETIEAMDAEEWFEFLLHKYFFWKYTAPNRYATTTAQLNKYKAEPYGLDELFLIKKKILDSDKEEVAAGLKIASSIRGLGTAGASGLLAVLYPAQFATVDQFVVKALLETDGLPERTSVASMIPAELKINDAVILIEIMKRKAKELNKRFQTAFWTPRKIDMILWSIGR